MLKLSIIIPACNEEGSLEKVVNRLIFELQKQPIEYEIIIVDDNSFDRTGKIADGLSLLNDRLKVIHRLPPAGFGRAIQAGLKASRGEIIIPFMGDNSDSPGDVLKLYKKIIEGYDFVYASRFIPGAKINGYPFLKLIFNRLGNFLIRILFGLKEKDITNSFKAYRKETLALIGEIQADEFDITVEIPLKAEILRLKKTSVPVSWQGRESGFSKLKLRALIYRYLKMVFKIWRQKIQKGENRAS